MWIECQEKTKLVAHAPRSTCQNYTTDTDRITTYEVSAVNVLLRIAYIWTTIACANA